jgi:hypothetical protein
MYFVSKVQSIRTVCNIYVYMRVHFHTQKCMKMWRTAASVCLSLLHQYAVCVCTHAQVCMHVYMSCLFCVWFNDLWLFVLPSFLISNLLASSSNFCHYAASFGKLRMVNSLMGVVEVKPCEIWGSLSHCSVISKSLLMCYIRSDRKQLLVFQRSIVPSS